MSQVEWDELFRDIGSRAGLDVPGRNDNRSNGKAKFTAKQRAHTKAVKKSIEKMRRQSGQQQKAPVRMHYEYARDNVELIVKDLQTNTQLLLAKHEQKTDLVDNTTSQAIYVGDQKQDTVTLPLPDVPSTKAQVVAASLRMDPNTVFDNTDPILTASRRGTTERGKVSGPEPKDYNPSDTEQVITNELVQGEDSTAPQKPEDSSALDSRIRAAAQLQEAAAGGVQSGVAAAPPPVNDVEEIKEQKEEKEEKKQGGGNEDEDDDEGEQKVPREEMVRFLNYAIHDFFKGQPPEKLLELARVYEKEHRDPEGKLSQFRYDLIKNGDYKPKEKPHQPQGAQQKPLPPRSLFASSPAVAPQPFIQRNPEFPGQTGDHTELADYNAQPVDYSFATLRPKYGLAGVDNVIPPVDAQLKSDLEFDMFSVVAPGFGLGSDNKMFLQEATREKNIVHMKGQQLYRRWDGPSLAPRPAPWQLQEVMNPNNVEAFGRVQQRWENAGKSTYMREGPTLEVLGDDVAYPLPLTSSMLPHNPRSPLEPIYSNLQHWTPVRPRTGLQLNAKQFRRDFDSQRWPDHDRALCNGSGGPHLSKRRALEVILQ